MAMGDEIRHLCGEPNQRKAEYGVLKGKTLASDGRAQNGCKGQGFERKVANAVFSGALRSATVGALPASGPPHAAGPPGDHWFIVPAVVDSDSTEHDEAQGDPNRSHHIHAASSPSDCSSVGSSLGILVRPLDYGDDHPLYPEEPAPVPWSADGTILADYSGRMAAYALKNGSATLDACTISDMTCPIAVRSPRSKSSSA